MNPIDVIAGEVNFIFERVVRTKAVPPIKGEITSGKLRWRGIRLKEYNSPIRTSRWIEQRGEKIGPTVEINVINPNLK